MMLVRFHIITEWFRREGGSINHHDVTVIGVQYCQAKETYCVINHI
jgi:hypothetical protein